MNDLEKFNDWIAGSPWILNLAKYLVLIVVVFAIIQVIRRAIKKRIGNVDVRYRTQKAIEIFGYVFIILLSIFYFTGNIEDFTLMIGLLTAGITITLQELILSLAGSLYIFAVGVYKPGDRIEINGIKGDVMDVDSVYTTMMEIGQWVSSDNYSGRIVKLSNAFVFKGPVFNYSQDFPFIWDEINIPIRYGSDLQLAQDILTEVANKELDGFSQRSLEGWNKVVTKYYIENAMVKPTIALSLTDNWAQFNLRFIVDYKMRRVTKDSLFKAIKEAIEATEGKVQLASVTLEIVSWPETNKG